MTRRLKQFMKWFRHVPVKGVNCLITTRRGKVILDSSGWEEFEIGVEPGLADGDSIRIVLTLTQLVTRKAFKNFQLTDPHLGVKR